MICNDEFKVINVMDKYCLFQITSNNNMKPPFLKDSLQRPVEAEAMFADFYMENFIPKYSKEKGYVLKKQELSVHWLMGPHETPTNNLRSCPKQPSARATASLK
jgi:hypothetical protein